MRDGSVLPYLSDIGRSPRTPSTGYAVPRRLNHSPPIALTRTGAYVRSPAPGKKATARGYVCFPLCSDVLLSRPDGIDDAKEARRWTSRSLPVLSTMLWAFRERINASSLRRFAFDYPPTISHAALHMARKKAARNGSASGLFRKEFFID